ncbi:MAG: hypothetical protein BIFFINMI_01709 [Phycisphaerae bacterium]|nr:hypothetical protein [Phycisphaerae bacterium]
MTADISDVLDGWPYESGQITVRRIRGLDGREKLQLRLDLGLLQMELQDRPDGRRPHGCPTALDYAERLLAEHRGARGTLEGFVLDDAVCGELREEALMNYHRYLSLYVLEDFDGVVRDTSANLRIFDLIKRFSRTPAEQMSMEQYRPYVTMMNSRAQVQQALGAGDLYRAMAVVNSGLGAIRSFFRENGHPELYQRSSEVEILKDLRREVSAKLPKDPLRELQKKLRKAVQTEHYEDAARFRDQIDALKTGSVQPEQPTV